MGHRILLADDSLTIQKVVELTFSETDYELMAVGSGDRAVEALEEFRPDIVLADVVMPGLTGYEVCEAVKRRPDGAAIPVVLLTGTFEPFDRARAERVGCDSIVTKPFDSHALSTLVRQLIAKGAEVRAGLAAAPPPLPPPPVLPPPPPVPAADPFSDTIAVQVPAPVVRPIIPEDVFGSMLPEEPLPPVHEEVPIPAAEEPIPPIPAWPEPAMAEEAPPATDGPILAAEEAPVAAAPEMHAAGAAEVSEVADAPEIPEISEVLEVPDIPEVPEAATVIEVPETPAAGPFTRSIVDEDTHPLLLINPAPVIEAEPLEEEGPEDVQPRDIERDLEAFEQTGKGRSRPEVWDQAEALGVISRVETSGEHTAVDRIAPSLRENGDIEVLEAQARMTDLSQLIPVPREPAPAAASALSDAEVERIARRVIQMIGERILKDIAWDVVPEMADRIVRERLAEIEKG